MRLLRQHEDRRCPVRVAASSLAEVAQHRLDAVEGRVAPEAHAGRVVVEEGVDRRPVSWTVRVAAGRVRKRVDVKLAAPLLAHPGRRALVNRRVKAPVVGVAFSVVEAREAVAEAVLQARDVPRRQLKIEVGAHAMEAPRQLFERRRLGVARVDHLHRGGVVGADEDATPS